MLVILSQGVNAGGHQFRKHQALESLPKYKCLGCLSSGTSSHMGDQKKHLTGSDRASNLGGTPLVNVS
jgi:hypothetical protein